MDKVAPAKIEIKRVFIDLVEKKGFSKVTVKNITDKVGICRSTFYLHYVDKYALMDSIQSDLLKGLGNIMLNVRATGPKIWHDTELEEKAMQICTNYFKYVQNNSRLFMLLLSEKGDGMFFDRLHRFFLDWMNQSTEEAGLNYENMFSAIIPSWVYIGLISYWLKTNMTLPPDELGKILLSYWRKFQLGKGVKF